MWRLGTDGCRRAARLYYKPFCEYFGTEPLPMMQKAPRCEQRGLFAVNRKAGFLY